MKCPNCGNELESGKLLCEKCGEEIKIVPDYDIELEATLKESINSMLEDMAVQEQGKGESEPDDTGDTFRDGFLKEAARLHKIKKTALVLIAALTVVLAVTAVKTALRHRADTNQYNSYEYQYNKAVECAEYNQYSEAVSYLERALAIDAGDLDARFLLAKYYDKNGQQQSTMSLLEEILNAGTDYARRDEVYDMLLGIYESRSDYAKIDDALKSCEIPRIVAKYNQYAAWKPEFSQQGGVYDEPISLSLTGSSQGTVYYTLDGTEPAGSASVYRTPILLESGDYIIRAVFVNAYGVESEIETRHYHINVSAPDSPVVNPESGSYTEPCLIEAFHDNNTKVYYTTDGSVPDKNSSRYMDPLEMPYGMSNFSFVSIEESGMRSEVVNRSYQLEVQANFDPELAVQVLKNNLYAAGKLLDTEGHVPNKPGLNQYRVQTLYEEAEAVYYIVYEEYMDTMEKVHDTHNFYAVEVNTADLYKAYKIDEGKYNLRSFAE